jgi:hypothetical protein
MKKMNLNLNKNINPLFKTIINKLTIKSNKSSINKINISKMMYLNGYNKTKNLLNLSKKFKISSTTLKVKI